MQGVTEWGHDALKYEAHDGLSVMLSADIDEAHDGLLVMIWLASPLTSSAIPPSSGVMQGVTEWGHDALNDEAHGLRLRWSLHASNFLNISFNFVWLPAAFCN